MRTESIQLPSGAEIIIRQLKLREENTLAQAAKTRGSNQNKILNDVLDACFVEWVSTGPYTKLVHEDRPRCSDMLSGDKFAAMIELRKISYRDGEKYILSDIECPSGNCRMFDYEVDLATDLSRRDLTEEHAEKVASGTPFEVTIADKKVSFSLASSKTEDMFEKLDRQNPGRDMATRLRSRILDVEGVERRDILNWLDGNNGQSSTFDGLTSQDSEDLRDAFDLHECGIDTEIFLSCPQCGREAYIDLPFDSGFLCPGVGIKKRQKERRRGKA